MPDNVSWAESYLGRLRARVGDDEVLLFVGARAVIRDGVGRVLLVRRSDNGEWALPAGALEVGESIVEAAIREVREETGLSVTALTPFALYTGKEYTRTNQFGHTYQLHVTVFRVDAWEGDLRTRTEETTDARFYPPDQLPERTESISATSIAVTLGDLAAFEATGRLVVR